MQQMQQQQHEAEQAHHREAALLEEELACCRDTDTDSLAEAESTGGEVGFAFGPGGTMRGTMRATSGRPGSISPLRRKQSTLTKTLSMAGAALLLVAAILQVSTALPALLPFPAYSTGAIAAALKRCCCVMPSST